ncbi:MAG TPA: sigma-70 family RNA polymerase sigma factor [Gemmatimonadaceae bacterium]|nr:sigma-70 family RNA polymerase sigma factor [Gemmatimonadaceae bacterium]
MSGSLQVCAHAFEPTVANFGCRLMDIEHHTSPKRAPMDASTQRQSNTSTWPDSWLINAVRREPPDEDALNALVNRYWNSLYARCRLLTADGERARDLAQESWLRVLRARHSLEPDGHFQAYIMTIATNLWRDMNRASVRAGPAAENKMASLESPIAGDDDESIALGNILPDPHSLSADDQLLLEMDLDDALARLEPKLRDVLVARFISGESAAEIGQRYGRTEQAITGWIREASRQMRGFLGEASSRDHVTENR